MFLLVCWSRIAGMYERIQDNLGPFTKKSSSKSRPLICGLAVLPLMCRPSNA